MCRAKCRVQNGQGYAADERSERNVYLENLETIVLFRASYTVQN